MITKVKGIGFTIGKGDAGKGIANPEAITFKKAEINGHKAVRILDIIITKDNGENRIAKLSLRQIHNLVTNQDVAQLEGVNELPKTAEESDVEGAKATAKWLVKTMPKLKQLVAEGALVCEYSLKDEEGIAPDGKTYTFEKANIASIYVSNADVAKNLVAANCNYNFDI